MQLLQTYGADLLSAHRRDPLRRAGALADDRAGAVERAAVRPGARRCTAPAAPWTRRLRSSRSSTASAGVRRLRRVLVGAQFAIATPLLIVAGLLLASLNQLKQVDLGFDTDASADRLDSPAGRAVPGARAHQRVLGRAAAPRRRAARRRERGASPTACRRTTSGNTTTSISRSIRPAPDQSQPVTPWVAVSPDYFRDARPASCSKAGCSTSATRSRRTCCRWSSIAPGRGASSRTTARSASACAAAAAPTCPWTTVVGVVSEVKYDGLDQPDEGTVYWPIDGGTFRFLIVRSNGDPLSVAPSVRQVIRELEPAAPLSNVATVDELVDQSLQRPQSLSLLVGELRRRRAAAVDHRHLRRDGLLRAAAPEGDQHPHRARRQPRRRGAAGDRPGDGGGGRSA